MTNLARLKLELSDKQYFSDEIYTNLLEEHNLDANDPYDQMNDRINLLETVYSVLQSLANNIDTFRSVQTEFTTVSAAYSWLQKRLSDLRGEIDRLKSDMQYTDEFGNTSSMVSYMFYNTQYGGK